MGSYLSIVGSAPGIDLYKNNDWICLPKIFTSEQQKYNSWGARIPRYVHAGVNVSARDICSQAAPMVEVSALRICAEKKKQSRVRLIIST